MEGLQGVDDNTKLYSNMDVLDGLKSAYLVVRDFSEQRTTIVNSRNNQSLDSRLTRRSCQIPTSAAYVAQMVITAFNDVGYLGVHG